MVIDDDVDNEEDEIVEELNDDKAKRMANCITLEDPPFSSSGLPWTSHGCCLAL